MNCFTAMMGNDKPVIIHGRVLSILFARAISSAPALQGLAKSVLGDGCTGLPSWGVIDSEFGGCSRDGDSVGDENESRYKPMKNSSLKRQKINNTVYYKSETVLWSVAMQAGQKQKQKMDSRANVPC